MKILTLASDRFLCPNCFERKEIMQIGRSNEK